MAHAHRGHGRSRRQAISMDFKTLHQSFATPAPSVAMASPDDTSSSRLRRAPPDSPEALELHRILAAEEVGLEVWTNEDWKNLLQEGPAAFSRALQEAETAMEKLTHTEAVDTAKSPITSQSHPPTHERYDSTTVPIAPNQPATADETHAFTQWATRIARLHILNVDDEIDESFPEHHKPKYTHPEAAAVLALSLTSNEPEKQLLRMRVLLAEEEAKNVDLEDRVSRLTYDLTRSRSENSQLRAQMHALEAKHLQNIAGSQGCAEGCQSGIVRLENETLREHNADLQAQVAACSTQLQQLLADMQASQRSAPLDTITESSATTDSTALSVPSSLSVHVSSPRPSPRPSSSPSPSSHSVSLSLLRVRSALALARTTLRHQAEIHHLMQHKLSAISLQTQVDDLDDQLTVERELRAVEEAEHVKSKARIEELLAQEHALQHLTAQLSQQLQKHTGVGLSVSMSSPSSSSNALSVTADDSSSSTTGAGGGANFSTPAKRTGGPTVTIGSLVSPTSSDSAGSSVSTTSAASAGSSGWGLGLGWVFGGTAQKQKPGAGAAAGAGGAAAGATAATSDGRKK